MLSIDQKVMIRRMRALGCTFREIESELGFRVARSSMSYICRDVALPTGYAAKLKSLNNQNLAQARQSALKANYAKRQIYLESLRLRNTALPGQWNVPALKLALAMLYLGEGSKWRSYRGLSLGSSEPAILLTYVKLLDACYGIKLHQLKARIQCRADQDIAMVEDFWARTLGLARTQFYRTYIDARTIGRPTKRSDYRGVCVIMCSGTEVQIELSIIADLLLKYFDET